MDPAEVCDDGNTVPGDFCDERCASDERCGNGIVENDESCDCGRPDAPGPASCLVAGATGTELTFNGGAVCTVDCARRPACGNGVIEPGRGEACDDGANVSGDGCSSDCRSNESCGNGVRDVLGISAPEECDDGNTANADGCQAGCERARCGDGILDPAEACDDGNLLSGDLCSAACAVEACGNGVADAGEACDDGNGNQTDECRYCDLPRCGDGSCDVGELCERSAWGPTSFNCRTVAGCEASPRQCLVLP